MTVKNVVEDASFSSMQAKDRGGELGARCRSILLLGNVDEPESFKVRRGKIGGYFDYLRPEDIAHCEEAMDTHQYNSALVKCAHIMLIRR